MSKQTKKNTLVLSALEEDLLTLLSGRSLYGLEFVTATQEASDGERDVGFGSLYPTLTRMEKKKLVTWRWGDEQSGPRRKYYDITPYGRFVLEKTQQYRKDLKQWALAIDTPALDTEQETIPDKTLVAQDERH